jgi:hypothetical protein
MTDRLVDGQPQMAGVKHQVVLARLHRRRLQLFARLGCRRGGVFEHVVGVSVRIPPGRQQDLVLLLPVQVFVTHAHRRRHAVATAELAAGLVDGGHRHGRPDAVDVLVDVGAIGRGEVLLLVDQEQHRVAEIRTCLHGRRIDAKQQLDLVLDRHFHGVLDDRRGPRHLAHAGRGRQLHRAGLHLRVCLGNLHGLARGIGHGIGREIGGAEKPQVPSAITRMPTPVDSVLTMFCTLSSRVITNWRR